MRADRAIGPSLFLPKFDSLSFVGEDFVLGYVFHTQSLLNYYGYVKCIIPQNLDSKGVTRRFLATLPFRIKGVRLLDFERTY